MDKTERIGFSVFGYQPSSFSDYPGKTAAVFFASGCNMRCSYCHNLKFMESASALEEEKLAGCLEHATANRVSDAVVITGGEPTLQAEGLKKFIRALKRRSNKLIKLDTNGTNPETLRGILDENLVDLAMVIIIHLPRVVHDVDVGNVANNLVFDDIVRRIQQSKRQQHHQNLFFSRVVVVVVLYYSIEI